jgi:hypothetical protein
MLFVVNTIIYPIASKFNAALQQEVVVLRRSSS